MSILVPGALILAAKLYGKELPHMYNNMMHDIDAEEIADIANGHALGAAAASLAAGWIPGAGGTAALLASAGFIWSMYYRINTACGIKLDKALLKSLGSAVLSNIVTQAAGVLTGTVVSSVLSFIPGIGTVVAEVIMASVVYATVVAAAVMYLKLMTKLFKEGVNVESMKEDELKASAAAAAKEVDVQNVVREARAVYTNGKKSGSITGEETVDTESFQ